MKSYVVFAERGEYSDYRAWVVASFDSPESAARYATELNEARDRFFDFECQREDCKGWYEVPVGTVVNRMDIFASMMAPKNTRMERRHAMGGCECPERPIFEDPVQGSTREYVTYTVVEVEKNPEFVR